jgi:hypothetical protein
MWRGQYCVWCPYWCQNFVENFSIVSDVRFMLYSFSTKKNHMVWIISTLISLTKTCSFPTPMFGLTMSLAESRYVTMILKETVELQQNHSVTWFRQTLHQSAKDSFYYPTTSQSYYIHENISIFNWSRIELNIYMNSLELSHF